MIGDLGWKRWLMAEEDLYFTKEKQPHAIEPGAFVLDLYRLICMVSASRVFEVIWGISEVEYFRKNRN